MRQKLIISLIFIVVLSFSKSHIYAQSTENLSKLKVFGLGMHIEQFKLTDITMNIATAPANKIILTITPQNNFRLEPEIGFISLKDKETDLTNRSISVGIGAFGMVQKGKTNIYGGLRFEYGNISSEYEDWNTGGIITDKTNRITIGPSIGAEFFLGEHFSFGGELGLKYMSLKSDDNQTTIDDAYFTTESGLLLRFYF